MVSHSPCPFPGMLCASPCSCGSPASPRVFKKQIPLLHTFSPSSDMHYRKLSFSYSFFFLLSRSQENLSKQFFPPGVNYWGNMLLENQAEEPKIPLPRVVAGTLRWSPFDPWAPATKISAQTNSMVERPILLKSEVCISASCLPYEQHGEKVLRCSGVVPPWCWCCPTTLCGRAASRGALLLCCHSHLQGLGYEVSITPA